MKSMCAYQHVTSHLLVLRNFPLFTQMDSMPNSRHDVSNFVCHPLLMRYAYVMAVKTIESNATFFNLPVNCTFRNLHFGFIKTKSLVNLGTLTLRRIVGYQRKIELVDKILYYPFRCSLVIP